MPMLPQADPALMQLYLSQGGVVGPGTLGSLGGASGMPSDPQQQVQWAAQQLGLSPEQARGHLDQIANYLNQQGGNTNWGSSPSAGDWLSYQGKGFDVLPAGDANWQWLRDPGTQEPEYQQQGAVTGQGQPGGSGSLMDDPGYQFRLGEGLKALQRSAAARGTLLTGGTLKGLQRYAQDYASGEYQNAFNRNMGVADLGLRAANGLVGAGTNFGRQAGDLYTGIGNAQAGGTAGRAGQWQGALGDLTNMASDYWQGKTGGMSF